MYYNYGVPVGNRVQVETLNIWKVQQLNIEKHELLYYWIEMFNKYLTLE